MVEKSRLIMEYSTLVTCTFCLSIYFLLFLVLNLKSKRDYLLLKSDEILFRFTSNYFSKNIYRENLSKVENFVNDYFKDTEIDQTIIKISNEGEVTIKIGSNDKLVSVDRDDLIKNPVEALEKAYLLYKQEASGYNDDIEKGDIYE
jgi:transcriptional regulator of heat shock response